MAARAVGVAGALAALADVGATVVDTATRTHRAVMVRRAWRLATGEGMARPMPILLPRRRATARMRHQWDMASRHSLRATAATRSRATCHTGMATCLKATCRRRLCHRPPMPDTAGMASMAVAVTLARLSCRSNRAWPCHRRVRKALAAAQLTAPVTFRSRLEQQRPRDQRQTRHGTGKQAHTQCTSRACSCRA